MCGIAGVLAEEGTPAVAYLYEALLALQHRGQDAAGIVTENNGRLSLRKDNGMVRDVFSQEHIAKLSGSTGIGHVRYPTAGSSCSAEAQPFYVNSPFGIMLAHNGNLVNTDAIKADLASEWRHLNTGSDSEALLNILAAALREGLNAKSPASFVGEVRAATTDDMHAAVQTVMERCIGGYAVLALVVGWGLVAFRDPNGIRPLVYGSRVSEKGEKEFMCASESGALSVLGFDVLGDVPPGHAVFFCRGQEADCRNCLKESIPKPLMAPCLFEYVYFARPDSILDGVSVYRSRLRMGDKLARRILKTWPKHDIDVVIPVPDTSRTSALESAAVLGIKYREGFIKNRYIGRTFIMPQQGLRKKSVRQKLAPISSEFSGRNVLLVDDSIVRGTTVTEIIKMARAEGAKKVYIASAAPPVRYPNVYGIDMPTRDELLAHQVGDVSHEELEEKVAQIIGADKCFYQTLGDLQDSVLEEAREVGLSLDGLDSSCFDGSYITEKAVSADYLQSLARTRSKDRGDDAQETHLLDHLENPSKAARVR